MEREKRTSEHSFQSCLEGMGISLLSGGDVLGLVFHHGPTLTSSSQIAHLFRYESKVVDAALDRLERERIIERVILPEGECLHRMLVPANDRQRHCLQQLVSLSERRGGRRLLVELRRPIRTESGQEEQSA
jgi:DNA-binding MarR family transcriptional regulator